MESLFKQISALGRENAERIRAQTTEYLASDRFEQHLDQFAGVIGLTHTPQVTETLDRDLRVKNKIKAVLQKCRTDVEKTTMLGGSVGSVFSRLGTVRLTVIFGSVHLAFLFLSAVSILIADNEEFKRLAARIAKTP